MFARLLCRLGFHRWHYHDPDSRTCRRCGAQEIRDPDSPSGFAGDAWRPV